MPLASCEGSLVGDPIDLESLTVQFVSGVDDNFSNVYYKLYIYTCRNKA